MSQETIKPTLVEKEAVPSLHFPNGDVLKSEDDLTQRRRSLEQAIKLGNNQKRKVKIIFEDADGIKKTETTIWGITDRSILLKAGVRIPIERIHSVSPY